MAILFTPVTPARYTDISKSGRGEEGYQSFSHIGLYCVDKSFGVNSDRIGRISHSGRPDHLIVATFVR